MSDTTTVHRSELDLPLLHRGKVRDVYEVDADTLLMVASDRVSAFDVVLPERWRDAVPVLQILALGSIFRLVGMPALALIRAQGRFGVLAVLTVILGVLFLIGVAIGATLGGFSELLATCVELAETSNPELWQSTAEQLTLSEQIRAAQRMVHTLGVASAENAGASQQ